MRIGFDIDNTIFPTSNNILKRLRVLYPEKDIRMDMLYVMNVEVVFGIPEREMWDIVDKVVLGVMTPYTGVVETINELAIDNDIFFVTARPEWQCVYTNEVLEDLFDIDFTLECSELKYKIIEYYDIDVFVEDSLKTARNIVERTSCKVILYDKPWNRIDSTFNRVKNWKELKDLIVNYCERWDK